MRDTWGLRNDAQPAALAVRGVVLLAGIALLLLPGALHPVPVLLTAVGIGCAVVAPRTIGVTVLSIGFVIAWIAADGWAQSLPVARAVPAAVALYLAHVSTALAAATPLTATLTRAAVIRWVRASVLPVLLAVVVVTVDEVLPQRTGVAWAEVAGLVALLGLTGAAVSAVRRRAAD